MSNELVSVIIVNWNGRSYLQKCLASLYQQDYPKIEVVLVDNASVDGSVDFVRENFSQVKIIINERNLGFAEANNIGYRASQGKFILFLNNDTVVTKDFMVELVRVLEDDPTIAGVQSKILLMDDYSRLDSVGAFLTPTGFLYHYGNSKIDSPQYNKQIDVYSAKGACMMFKRAVLENVKVEEEIFDSRYFAYFEETDLCHRVWLAGYRIVFVPTSTIYHKVGGTSEKMDNAFIQYHSFKNRINSYIKNLDVYHLVKILPLHLLLSEVYAFISLLKFKLYLFLAIQSALIWNVQNIRTTLIKRRIIQSSIRRVQDKTLFSKTLRPVRLSYYYYLFSGLVDRYEE